MQKHSMLCKEIGDQVYQFISTQTVFIPVELTGYTCQHLQAQGFLRKEKCLGLESLAKPSRKKKKMLGLELALEK